MKTHINQNDPLKKQEKVEKLNNDTMSPMAPPEAYEGSTPKDLGRNSDNKFLQELEQDHIEFMAHINSFISAMHDAKEKKKIEADCLRRILSFFEYFDKEFVIHNKKEERYLFPILTKRLIESGEHSVGLGERTTPIDILESEHMQALQLGAIISNAIEILPRIKNEDAHYSILANAVNKGFVLAELLKLHIHREDNIIFVLAKNLLTDEDVKEVESNF